MKFHHIPNSWICVRQSKNPYTVLSSLKLCSSMENTNLSQGFVSVRGPSLPFLEYSTQREVDREIRVQSTRKKIVERNPFYFF